MITASKQIPRARSALLRTLFALAFVAAGIGHLVVPDFYLQIMPPFLPHPKLLVAISGIAQIAGGVGLLVASTRRAAAFGLVLLLIAVFPANIYMAAAHVPATGWAGNRWLQWLRLPLQIPLIWWAWRYTRRVEGEDRIH